MDDATLQEIRAIILGCEGVRDLHLLKTRKMGHQALAEVHLQVAPTLSVSEGHQIAERVRMALLRQVADLMDATIHIDSENDEQGSPVLPARSQIEAAIRQALLAAQLPLPEQVTLHYLGGSVEARLQYLLPSAGALDSLHQQERSIHRALDGGKMVRLSGMDRMFYDQDTGWIADGMIFVYIMGYETE
ncbi:MAG: hypothetical protein B7Z70_16125 [Acidithiobacillus ferrivorans]|uniref:Cation efflux protein cytoplasmic domain-containing protein n=1 Tax=Acidithiobacillus ferrivorans TaxID=160808 RepID=A0A257SGW1_9PROT|nr:MAG: hypothetical protein B7Z70_16125 [Acidithiobacillus ferrivorans]